MRQLIAVVFVVVVALIAPLSARGATLEELEEQLRVLNEKVEQMRRERQEQKQAEELQRQREGQRKTEAGPATQEGRPLYREILGGVRVGGYGSFRFETSNLEEVNDTFTFRRFVLTLDAPIAERLRSAVEVEFERFTQLELERTTGPEAGGLRVEQAVEGSDESEISLEQGWIEYELARGLRFRGGVVLVPLGRFNINHDDNRWDLPRRPLVDRGIPVLPVKAAWPEVGAGFVGDVDIGPGTLSYQALALNGVSLDTELEEIAQTRFPRRDKIEVEVELRPSRGTANLDLKNDKAFAGRFAYSLLPDYELGVSGYFGRYTPEFLQSEVLWALGADGKATFGPFEIEGEYIYTRFNDTAGVARSLARVARDRASEIPGAASPNLEVELELELAQLAEIKHGYWVDFRYRFFPEWLRASFLGRRFQSPQLIATLRWEQAFLNDLLGELTFANGGVTALEREDRNINRLTLGLAYRPVPLVVFQLAYEFTRTNDGKSLADVTNFLPARAKENDASAFLFGVAFGF